MAEVAYSTGFSDPAYFSKCFKELYGKTPTDYVQELGEALSGS
ncbi:helix-turn-helix domain-containing protein [Pontibacter rugosus]